jgi:Protein of unknown function (DUF964).
LNELVLEKVESLVECIKESADYVKYLEISERLKKNKEIMNIIDEVKDLQKKIVKEEHNGNDFESLEKEIEKKLNMLNSYPIYVEFTYVQEDLNNTFQNIKDILEKYISSKTN